MVDNPALSQFLPPSVKEILSAYVAKGENDRDVLLAILQAKIAEDQRISALASLHEQFVHLQRQALEAHQQAYTAGASAFVAAASVGRTTSPTPSTSSASYSAPSPSAAYQSPRSDHTPRLPSPTRAATVSTPRKRRRLHAEHPVSNDRNAGEERDELADDDESDEAIVEMEKQKRRRIRTLAHSTSAQFLPLSPASPATRPLALAPARRPMDIHNMLGPSASPAPAERDRWVQTSAERSTSLET